MHLVICAQLNFTYDTIPVGLRLRADGVAVLYVVNDIVVDTDADDISLARLNKG